MIDRDALDRHITDSRYSEERCIVRCPACERDTFALLASEYGQSEYVPAECACGRAFDGSEAVLHDDGPRDPDRAYDLSREEKP